MGKSLARMLAEKGANVVIVARNEAKLAEAFKSITVGEHYEKCKQGLTCSRQQLRTQLRNASMPYQQM